MEGFKNTYSSITITPLDNSYIISFPQKYTMCITLEDLLEVIKVYLETGEIPSKNYK